MRRTGAERVIEVLVGGAVALILGVVLFPAEPLSILREAERSLLRALARTLEQVAGLVAADEQSQDGWTLETGHEIHRQLAALARAWSTARANVRVPPGAGIGVRSSTPRTGGRLSWTWSPKPCSGSCARPASSWPSAVGCRTPCASRSRP